MMLLIQTSKRALLILALLVTNFFVLNGCLRTTSSLKEDAGEDTSENVNSGSESSNSPGAVTDGVTYPDTHPLVRKRLAKTKTATSNKTTQLLSIDSPVADSAIASSFVVSGSCERGLTISASVTDGGTSSSTICLESNFYSISLSLTGADGMRSVLVSSSKATDSNSEVSLRVRKDASPPVMTLSAPSASLINFSDSAFYSIFVSDESGMSSSILGKTVLVSTGTAFCTHSMSGSGSAADPFLVHISQCAGDGAVRVSIATGAVTDSAGNESLFITSMDSVLVDNTSPLATINSPPDGTSFGGNPVTTALTGSCETDLIVTLAGDVTPGQTVMCQGGSFSFSTWSLSSGNGVKSVAVRQTDSAGNTGAPASHSYVLSILQAPNSPSLNAKTVAGLRDTLNGTCDSSATFHTATTTLGNIRSVSCSSGILSVLVHLPMGSSSFDVNVTSTNAQGSSHSGAVTFNRQPFTCPAGYVAVPASGVQQLGHQNASANGSASNGDANWWLDVERDFCVMKYPAKNNHTSTYATSTASGTPWVSIQRGVDESSPGRAFKACKDNPGGKYRLISNTQWQTVARNAENVASNWSGNAVGSGALVKGHSDNTPSNSLANSTDDDPYYGTENSASDSLGSGWEQRRTLTLTNSEVVWDFAGNVWQWVSDNYSDLGANPEISGSWNEFSHTTYFPSGGINRLLFAPNGNFTSIQNTGQLYGGTPNYIYRGGQWGGSGSTHGLFAASLHPTSSSYANFIGFRCVYLP